MSEYEVLVYSEDESESSVEPKNEAIFLTTFKTIQHGEPEMEKNQGADNIKYVKRYLGSITTELEKKYVNKISKLNTSLLKKVATTRITSFTLEEYRYYRFLNFLRLENGGRGNV
jgi:hypothetical protein